MAKLDRFGISLMEIVVVLSIVGVFAVMVLPNYVNQVEAQRGNAALATINMLRVSINDCVISKGLEPPNNDLPTACSGVSSDNSLQASLGITIPQDGFVYSAGSVADGLYEIEARRGGDGILMNINARTGAINVCSGTGPFINVCR